MKCISPRLYSDCVYLFTLLSLKLIPDFDKISQPTIIPNAYHAEIEITSQILGLKLSFRWQPLINDNVIKTMRRWADSYETERPHLIFLSKN